jgi:hypothetical protein
MAQGRPAVHLINAVRGLRRQIAARQSQAAKQATEVFPIPPQGKLL